MLRLIRPKGLTALTRPLSLSAVCDKRIQFFLSDIGEGTKEVVIKGTKALEESVTTSYCVLF